MAITIRPLTPADRASWEPLWQGYLTFYKTSIPAEVTENSWRRFHVDGLPAYALGAFDGDRMVGFVHYIFHLSNWLLNPTCYLQDLFTSPDARGKGVGRALIEAVYDKAREAGSTRVYWLTQDTNLTAMALYDKVATKAGFTQYRKDV